MLRLRLLLLTLAAAITPLTAQPINVHPDEPGALLIDTLTIVTTLQVPEFGQRIGSPDAPPREARVEYLVGAFRTSGSRVDVVIGATGIRVIEDDGVIDSTATVSLFDALGKGCIDSLISRSIVSCDSATDTSRVYTAACVQRTGSGTSTAFEPCDSGCDYRVYTYECGSGAPEIQQWPRPGNGCLAPCEPTMPTFERSDLN